VETMTPNPTPLSAVFRFAVSFELVLPAVLEAIPCCFLPVRRDRCRRRSRGTEAALVSARMGRSTLLLTHSIETLGQMSCNPSIGGIGKGHLVKEIDALGGAMALAADEAGIQFRNLNSSRGRSARDPRAGDRCYRHAIRSGSRISQG